MHELGVKIHLHCFEYGRGQQPTLNKYCVEVNYYKRHKGWEGFSFTLPYIVYSRGNNQLLQNLLKDKHPVLLEGIHCTYFLFTNQLKNRKVFVRLHNVEFEYYHQLAKNETSVFKKLYFKNESRLLKNYENAITDKAILLAITQKDAKAYKEKFDSANIKYLPAFTPYQFVTAREGKGDFCLYDGNLSVAENENVALWLIENIFNEINIPFIIAGKNPSKKLKSATRKNKNISLISNPSEEEMNELISNAQINILPAFGSTGIKIKLLNALFTGRHCLVNYAAVSETGIESLCHIAETAEEFKVEITRLFNEPFTAGEIEKRNQLLKQEFDNRTNAELLMQMI